MGLEQLVSKCYKGFCSGLLALTILGGTYLPVMAQELQPIVQMVPGPLYKDYISVGVKEEDIQGLFDHGVMPFNYLHAKTLNNTVSSEALLRALDAGFSYEQYIFLLESNIPPWRLNTILNPESAHTQVTGIEENKIITDYLDPQTIIDYILADQIRGMMVLYFNGISPETAILLKSNRITNIYDMIVINEIGENLEENITEYNNYLEITKNAHTAVALLNASVPLDYVTLWAEAHIMDEAIADLYYMGITGPEDDRVAPYIKEKINVKYLPDYVIAQPTIDEISEFKSRHIYEREIPYYVYFGIDPEYLDTLEKSDYISIINTYQFNEVILKRYEEGLIPDSKLPLFEKFGIRNFQRYPICVLQSTLDSLNNTSQNIALLVLNTEDDNLTSSGAFNRRRVYAKFAYAYDVIIYEVNTDDINEILSSLEETLLVLGGHGSRYSLRFGDGLREIHFLDRNDEDSLEGVGSPVLTILFSCSNGYGGHLDKDGNRVTNLANFIAEHLNSPVIAGNTVIALMDLVLNDDQTIRGVVFSQYIREDEMYYP